MHERCATCGAPCGPWRRRVRRVRRASSIQGVIAVRSAVGVFAGGQLRGGDGETFGAVEQEQDPARPCQRGDALDELPVPRQVGCAAVVMPLGRGGGVAPIGAGTRCAASRRGGRWALPRPAPHAPRLLALRTRHDCSSPRRRDRAPSGRRSGRSLQAHRRSERRSGTDGAGVRRTERLDSGGDRAPPPTRASSVHPLASRRRWTARCSVRCSTSRCAWLPPSRCASAGRPASRVTASASSPRPKAISARQAGRPSCRVVAPWRVGSDCAGRARVEALRRAPSRAHRRTPASRAGR